MKAVLSSAGYAALILKLTGGLMVIGSIADCLILLVPPNFLDQVWLSTVIRDWILYGPIPLIGFALLLLGAWIDFFTEGTGSARPAGTKTGKKNGKQAGRKKPAQSRSVTSVVFLSLCCSILFVLLIPLYFNSSRLASAAATRDINEQATQAVQQLNDRLAERREQINLLLSDSARREALQAQLRDATRENNALQSQLSAEQQTELQQLLDLAQRVQKNPSVLEQELTQAQQAGVRQIQTQQQQERDRITAETRKLRIHTILTALILAIGYGVIAWTGMSLPQQRQVRSRLQV